MRDESVVSAGVPTGATASSRERRARVTAGSVAGPSGIADAVLWF